MRFAVLVLAAAGVQAVQELTFRAVDGSEKTISYDGDNDKLTVPDHCRLDGERGCNMIWTAIDKINNRIDELNATVQNQLAIEPGTPQTSFIGNVEDIGTQQNVWLQQGETNQYCAQDQTKNACGYVDALVSGNTWEYSIRPGTGAPIVICFAYGSFAGENFPSGTTMSTGADPEQRNVYSGPRVCVSTENNPNSGKLQFWESSSSLGGRSMSSAEGIGTQFNDASSVLSFRRVQTTVNGANGCVIEIRKNGNVIKTANDHEWSNTQNGCGSGYFWIGHYNAASTPQLCIDMVNMP